jgi:molybdopterin-guanine dinucleotide biosynthesis protein A
MAEYHSNEIAVVVLAGGASSRMGRPKAHMPFLGQRLAERVIARLRNQAAIVYFNARADDAEAARLGVPLTPDSPRWRGAGPLVGVAAALERAGAEGYAALVTAPCDAPFAPLDLVARLLGAGAPAAVAVSAAGLEPMFALWPVSALGVVEAALASGRASPRAALQSLSAARVEFPPADGRDPLANLNTPQEFAAAEAAALLEAAGPAAPANPQGRIR